MPSEGSVSCEALCFPCCMYDTLFLLSTFQLQEVVQFISSSVTFCSLFPCCEERKIDFLKPQCRRLGGRSQRASVGMSLPLASLLGDRYQRVSFIPGASPF